MDAPEAAETRDSSLSCPRFTSARIRLLLIYSPRFDFFFPQASNTLKKHGEVSAQAKFLALSQSAAHACVKVCQKSNKSKRCAGFCRSFPLNLQDFCKFGSTRGPRTSVRAPLTSLTGCLGNVAQRCKTPLDLSLCS